MDIVNRSVRKTRSVIQNTFLALVCEKPYYKITVSEIAERADINRSTFYLHYNDVYALLNCIKNSILGSVNDAVNNIKREGYVLGEHPQHVAVFEVLNENRKACECLLSDNGDIGFLRELEECITEALCCGWSRYGECKTDPKIRMYATYIAFGIIGIFSSQIYQGKDQSPEDMGYFAGEVTSWIDESFVRHKEE